MTTPTRVAGRPLSQAVAMIWVAMATACGQDDNPKAASPRPSPPPLRAAKTVQEVRSNYRVLAGPVVVFAKVGGEQTQFKAYVRMNRALPRHDATLDIEGVSETAPFRASRRFNCYKQLVADYESPTLSHPRDGMKVTHHHRQSQADTHLHQQASHSTSGDLLAALQRKKEGPRLARLGCGPNART